jgi:pilus assembly protein CpaE
VYAPAASVQTVTQLRGTVHQSILLLATDRQSARAVTEILSRAGHAVTTVATSEELIREAGRYGLLILDGVPAGSTAASIIAEVRATPSLASTPTLAIAQSDSLDERIEFLEAGADDVLRKPYDPRELEALVEALSLRATRDAHPGMPAIGGLPRRKVVVVYSPKGGVGTTTIAVSLAVIAAERKPNAIALLDLDLQFGQVATHLNVQPRQSLLELIRDAGALADSELFRTYATPHDSGVEVFASPAGPGYASLFTAAHVEAFLDRATEAYDTVIVDAGNALDERTLSAITHAETLVIPVVPEIPSLRAVHALLDQLTENGATGARTLFVLNNIFSRDLLRLRDIEGALGGKIAAELPYDAILYLKAVNEGVPTVIAAAKSAPGERMRKLASLVLGSDAVAAPAGNAETKPRGLSGLLRRG